MAASPVRMAPTSIAPLKDQVLAILSLAARRGTTQVPILDFFRAFADLADEFTPMLPGLIFSRTTYSAYSKQLDTALQELVGFSVDLPNPKLQYLEVSQEAAGRHLSWLEEKYGKEYIDSLQPLAEALIQKLASS
jgi:hypothetical protein